MSQGNVRTLKEVVRDIDGPYGSDLVYTGTPHTGSNRWIFWYPHKTQEEKERHLKHLVESLSKVLLNSFLGNEKLHERYKKREALLVRENGEVNLCVFSSVQNGDTYTLTSSLLGVVITITDLGQNFVFNTGSPEAHTPHVVAEECLSNDRLVWSDRLQEVVISTDNLSFSGVQRSANHFYGYSPHAIADSILAYIPKALKKDFTSDQVLASLHSDDNLGIVLFTMFGTDVFFRLSVNPNKINPTEEEIKTERYAQVLSVTDTDGKILVRNTRVTAELVIRSSANFFDSRPKKDFDYRMEQGSMKKLSGIIYLGLSQWKNDGFESLGELTTP